MNAPSRLYGIFTPLAAIQINLYPASMKLQREAKMRRAVVDDALCAAHPRFWCEPI
jgi:hypothetical protein